MIKTIFQDDHPELLQSSGGERFQLIERNDRLTKSASAGIPREVVQQYLPDDRHFMLHLVALGDGEMFGANKNADYFSKEANVKYHPTFVSHGCFYREHANKDPNSQGIGHIKYAAHNPEAHRVELLVWGNKDKAEEEYELAKQASELSFSMSARLPWDRCNACGNIARRREDYCDHLTKSANQYIPELQKWAFAHNEHDLKFFDISRVKKPADRIAHYLAYKFGDDEFGMAKAASADSPILGVDWADYLGFSESDYLMSTEEKTTLEKMAAYEAYYQGEETNLSDMEKAYANQVKAGGLAMDFSQEELVKFSSCGLDTLNHELTKEAMFLSFPEFHRVLMGSTPATPAVRRVMVVRMPTMSRDMQQGKCCCEEDLVKKVQPSNYGTTFDQGGDQVQHIISNSKHEKSNSPEAVGARCTIRLVKSASESVSWSLEKEASDMQQLDHATANLYGHYLVSSVTAATNATSHPMTALACGAVARNLFQQK